MTDTKNGAQPPVLLTIATCVLDAREDLLRTAASLPETLPEWAEWVVVDGASTDGTIDVAKQDPRVSRFLSERDRGVYDAYNKALSLAAGRYIWYLNAGDTADSPAWEELGRTITEASRSSPIPVLCHDVEMQVARRTWRPEPDKLLDGMSVPTPGALIPTEALRELGGFDAWYRISADYDVLLRLYKRKAPFVTSPVTLTCYKGDGLSTVHADLAFFEECVSLVRADRSRAVHCLLRAARRLVVSGDPSQVPFRRWRMAMKLGRKFLY